MGKKQIYHGGTILTLEAEGAVPAVFVEDGIIRATGTKEQMEALAGSSAESISQKGAPCFLLFWMPIVISPRLPPLFPWQVWREHAALKRFSPGSNNLLRTKNWDAASGLWDLDTIRIF